MNPDIVTLGQSFTADVEFKNPDGTPFVATVPASWAIRDFSFNLILAGTGQQDNLNPARWFANSIVIPSNAPVSEADQRYQITWTISNPAATLVQTNNFSVKSALDYSIVELDRLALEATNLVDSLAVDSTDTIDNVTITLMTGSGSVIFTSAEDMSPGESGLSTVLLTNNKNVYTYVSPEPIAGMTAAAGGFNPYIIWWNYEQNGQVTQEYHFLSVVNPPILVKVHELRRFIDKAMSVNPNPALNYNDVDLVAYLDAGIQYINMARPTLTNWTLTSLPTSLQWGLIQAAAYVALSSQYLAEGTAAFEFQGQTVSLAVDRTPYIDNQLNRIIAYLERDIPTFKRVWLRSTGGTGQGAGVLGVNVGPSLGYSMLGFRMDLYRLLLLGIGG